MSWKTPEFVSALPPPDQARDSTERWKRVFAFFSDLLQLICKQIALPCVRERESCLIFYPRFKKLSSLKEHKSQWTSRHPRFQSIWVLKPTQVDIDHFPPLRPFPRGHYCSKKCRQAKKAEARRGRFALWGKTAARTRAQQRWMDSPPQLVSKKPSNLVPTSTPGNNNLNKQTSKQKYTTHHITTHQHPEITIKTRHTRQRMWFSFLGSMSHRNNSWTDGYRAPVVKSQQKCFEMTRTTFQQQKYRFRWKWPKMLGSDCIICNEFMSSRKPWRARSGFCWLLREILPIEELSAIPRPLSSKQAACW